MSDTPKEKRKPRKSLAEQDQRLANFAACKRVLTRLFGEVSRGEIGLERSKELRQIVEVVASILRAENKDLEARVAALEAVKNVPSPTNS
jgi:hypothetical protein